LSPDQAVGQGLILHELASSAQYGSLSALPENRPRMEGTRAEGGAAPGMTWRESGGPPVNTPRHGFGSI
jgi:two-component sensor histidine kinase